MMAVHLEDGRVEVRDVSPPRRLPGFAFIRLLRGGICNTDLELQRGYYDFSGTPGHEFVGEVVEADDPGLAGRRVAGEINLNCCKCQWCKCGLGRHCPSRAVLGIVNYPGAFSEFLTLPERNLHVVSDRVPDEVAVFIEPLAAACEILDQVSFPCGAEVAVLGDGKLGLLIAQVLAVHGFTVHQFGRHEEKLRIAATSGVETHLSAEFPIAAYQWVVDATGTSEGLRQAVRMVRPRGSIILKSTVHGMAQVDTAPIIVNEITLVGSRCGRFEPALQLLNRGLINVRDMISAEFPLKDAPLAFEKAASKGTLKVQLLGPGI